MKPLIDPADVEKGMLFLAVAGPLVGLILGALLSAHQRRSRPTVAVGVFIGALGTAAWGMWHVFGAITNRLGLDSLANLGLQLLLFVASGAVLGVVIAKVSLLIKGSGRANSR